MNTVFQYMSDMTLGMLAGLPLIAGIRLFSNIFRRARGDGTTFLHETLAVLFGIFLIGLFSQTILPELIALFTGTAEPSNSRINLTPFLIFRQTYIEVFRYGNLSYFLINFLGNILIFIPLGFLPPLLWRGMARFWKAALLGLGVSVLIEATQLLLPRGTDVDDVWLNTMGAVVGYLIFLLIRKCAPHFVSRCRTIPAAERNWNG